MAEEKIEEGDIVRFRDDFSPRRKGHLYKVTKVRKSSVYRSGVAVQVEGTKTFYDSGWLQVYFKKNPINFNL